MGGLPDLPEPAGALALGALLRATTAITGTDPGFLADGPDRTPPAVELHSLLCDRERPGTLGFAVHRLNLSAQAVREQLSTDTWLVLSRLDEVLARLAASPPTRNGPDPDLDGALVSGALDRVLAGLLALSGIEAESLVRDAGWHLLDAGRRIERAQHVVALLRETLGEDPGGQAGRLVTETTVIVAESVITHRRRHAGRRDVAPVLGLLLTDRDNPRAVAYQLARLEEDLGALPGPVPDALAATVERLAAADLGAAAARAADGSRAGLRLLLSGLGDDLARLAEQIAAAHFAHAAGPRPYDPLVATP
ncbi:alpha-E domain-containing protein [Pseudonocardia sp. T1-2H]|uniref:alpha-E domain-containing protein n=1 Tax=Pseudonocardia sp. T1-2H TaxID=3128899 RepID=UPI003100E5C9